MGFGDEVGKWSDETANKVELAIRKIAIDAFTRIVLRSPVDTGRFRGNWQVSIENIPIGTVNQSDESGSETIAEIVKVASELKGDQAIYLVNNLPYARRLEYGWSKQAPGGMVRLTVQEFQSIIKQIAEQIKGSS